MDTVKLEKRHQYATLHFHYQDKNSFPNPFPIYRDTQKKSGSIPEIPRRLATLQ